MLYPETIPIIDGCKTLERARAYVIDGGVSATLQFSFRDPSGAPITTLDSDTIYAVIREPLSHGNRDQTSDRCSDPIYKVTATRTSPTLMSVDLPDDLLDSPGIWGIEWGIVPTGTTRPNRIARSVLSIERSNWVMLANELATRRGPPTISEIRYAIRDNGRVDNVLLQRAEFGADEIMMAYTRPVTIWNEMRPQMPQYVYHTRSFPYREQWLRATVALLQLGAAAGYARNKMNSPDDPFNRDATYDRWARTDLAAYEKFVAGQKAANSFNQCWGEVNSDYSMLSGYL